MGMILAFFCPFAFDQDGLRVSLAALAIAIHGGHVHDNIRGVSGTFGDLGDEIHGDLGVYSQVQHTRPAFGFDHIQFQAVEIGAQEQAVVQLHVDTFVVGPDAEVLAVTDPRAASIGLHTDALAFRDALVFGHKTKDVIGAGLFAHTFEKVILVHGPDHDFATGLIGGFS